jgi:hypothetical protein
MLTDACVVIEDPGANATRFDRKASEVAKAPTRSVQVPAIYFARATRSSAAASVSKISSLGTGNSISFRFPGFPEIVLSLFHCAYVDECDDDPQVTRARALVRRDA